MDKPLNLATSFFEYFIYSYWVILRLESRADLVYGDMQKVDEINYNVWYHCNLSVKSSQLIKCN